LFNEANTVDASVRDRVCCGVTHHIPVGAGLARRNRQVSGRGWDYLRAANVPRQPHEALIRFNPAIAALPDRPDDVLYRLRAIVMTVADSGLVKISEKLAGSSLGVSSGGAFE
jgi:type I restriction enzyme, R subunit